MLMRQAHFFLQALQQVHQLHGWHLFAVDTPVFYVKCIAQTSLQACSALGGYA